MAPQYLLVKRDLYYRPNGEGYTGIRDHAGRYSQAEAEAHCYSAGPEGNSVAMIREDEAPEFTRACFDDLAREHLRKERDRLSAIVADFAAIYRDVWGVDDKKDADVCRAFEQVILRHNL